MSKHLHDIGDQVELKAAFTSRPLTTAERKAFIEDGTLPDETGVDPTTVTCTVRDPRGETTTPEAEGEDGIYTATVEPGLSGPWAYAFDGTGAYVAAGEGQFEVRKRKVPR